MSNITLFSGGEKALIAISCLFAILKVRPVPMCILDEVEAALIWLMLKDLQNS